MKTEAAVAVLSDMKKEREKRKKKKNALKQK